MGGSLAAVRNTDPGPAPAVRLGQAWRDLRRGVATSALAGQVFGRPGTPGAIDPGHLDVLDVLSAADGVRMSALAIALHLDPSTMTRTIHRMEGSGLVHRAAEPSDGRVVTVHLTPQGRRLHALAAARRTAVLERALAALPAGDRERFVDLFERFLHAVATTAASEGSPG